MPTVQALPLLLGAASSRTAGCRRYVLTALSKAVECHCDQCYGTRQQEVSSEWRNAALACSVLPAETIVEEFMPAAASTLCRSSVAQDAPIAACRNNATGAAVQLCGSTVPRCTQACDRSATACCDPTPTVPEHHAATATLPSRHSRGGTCTGGAGRASIAARSSRPFHADTAVPAPGGPTILRSDSAERSVGETPPMPSASAVPSAVGGMPEACAARCASVIALLPRAMRWLLSSVWQRVGGHGSLVLMRHT
jgi:hypothetical protein